MELRGLFSPEGDASLWRAGPPRVHRGGGISRARKESVAWLRMGRPRPELGLLCVWLGFKDEGETVRMFFTH